MSGKKRFWWLKLREGYFSTPPLKKLRRVAGGEVMTIIYLKMQLESLRNNGLLVFEGLEDTFAEELALTLDENTDDVELTLAALQKYKLLEVISGTEYMLPEAVENIGSESDSAVRMRSFRARASQSDDCEKNNNSLVSQSDSSALHRDTEKEEKKRREDLYSEKEGEREQEVDGEAERSAAATRGDSPPEDTEHAFFRSLSPDQQAAYLRGDLRHG